MKAGKKKTNCILWCIDPFSQELMFHEHAFKVLKPIARALKTAIQPIAYIDTYRALEQDGNRFPINPLISDPLELLEDLAQKRTASIWKGSNRALVLPLAFITHDPSRIPTLREKVSAIDEEAKKRRAIFVALHTHARKGLKRLYMGSFAETYMLYSDTPSMLLNPSSEPSTNFRKMLFATDFSAQSLTCLRRTAVLAKKARAAIRIVHCTQEVPEAASGLPSTIITRLNSDLKQREMKAKEKGERLARQLKGVGVRAEFQLLSSQRSFEPSDVIAEYAADQGFDLIMLAAQSGRLITKLLGATTRALVRGSSCPVLVYRT